MHGWIRKSRIAQEYPGSRSGIIRGLFGCLSVDGHHGDNSAPTRICQAASHNKHDARTNCPGQSR
ncbi:hypothetical protein DPMN_158911 [Dreissena polymorpha]|uniref:Uncharacterized protein n=1 Tax=Dreissena polymorpha TaxID=45954 RepID=A0A9D4IME7_DREPO|nr:hypothetical protein DPMN_158911 [Dreissena polymorpha]